MEKIMENVEYVEAVNEQEVEAVTEKKSGFFTKVGGFVKKHGKKIAVGAVVGVIGGICGYAIGKKGEDKTDTDLLTVDDGDIIDVDVSDIIDDVTEEEIYN